MEGGGFSNQLFPEHKRCNRYNLYNLAADTSSPQKQTNKPALLVFKSIDKLNFTAYDFRLHCMKNKLDISMKVNKKSSNFKIKN